MARPRKQTYTLDMYLKKNKKGDIDNNADVQRNFVWNNEQINELVVTVLTDDYIPPIILGEEEDTKLHIVDGGCRTAALRKFREMNYKITSSIENSLIPYKKRTVDKNGNTTYEDAVFDIKNKTFEKLPEELKEKFDEYQIETVIHECCDGSKISRYIKRYNNHVAMNTDQKAFTYIDRFASRIRKILDSRFFVECAGYSEKDKTKGAVERVVVETMMCMNHFDNWKTQPKSACKYLNDHASEKEFDLFAENISRLEKIITDDIRDIFNKKDSFIFLTLFDRFTRMKMNDRKFAEFLGKFNKTLRFTIRNEKGQLFDEIDRELSTKDRQVITDKLNMLEGLLTDYLRTGEEEMPAAAGKVTTAGKAMTAGKAAAAGKVATAGKAVAVGKAMTAGKVATAGKAAAAGKVTTAERAMTAGKVTTAGKAATAGKASIIEKMENMGNTAAGKVMTAEKAAIIGKAATAEKTSNMENTAAGKAMITAEAANTEKKTADKGLAEKLQPVTARMIIKEYVDRSVDDKDMELYELLTNDVSEAVEDIDSRFLSDENRPSFVALVSYAVQEDTEVLLKEWLTEFEKQGNLITDQTENFLYMRAEFDRFRKTCA